MGAHEKKAAPLNGDKLVSLSTSDLRDRLNRIYAKMRNSNKKADLGRFDYLWDLKEHALMQGTKAVDVPESWLDELETGMGNHPGH